MARERPRKTCCRQTLLAALARYGGREGRFRTQRSAVVRLFHALQPHGRAAAITTVSGTRLHRATTYLAEIPPELRDARSAKPRRRCCRRSELRAAFLACGSLPLPTMGYHLELVPPDEAAAQRIVELLVPEGLAPKRTTRRGAPLLYFKDAECVVGVLAAIGAHEAVLRLEDVRAVKETKNRIHRLVNVEAANVARAVAAASRQRHAIELLRDAYGLHRLSPPLREAAELRLRHPELTLGELAARCRPPANRQTLNGRLQALIRLAKTLQPEQASHADAR